MDQAASLILLPARERIATPWRNGAGSTREVVCVGSEAAFGWRVSVATIDRDAGFSRFDGYDRALLLAQGGPVRLTIAGRDVVLRAGDAPVSFAGEDEVTAQVVAPALAVNTIVRRETFRHRVRMLAIDRRKFVPATLVMALTTGLKIDSVALDPFDAILAMGEDDATLSGRGMALAISILPQYRKEHRK